MIQIADPIGQAVHSGIVVSGGNWYIRFFTLVDVLVELTAFLLVS